MRLRWHRRVGLSLALVFVFVVATGLLLNHAEDFELRSRVLKADWLHRWYGIQPKGSPVGYKVDDAWIIGLDGSVFINSRPVLDGMPLVGVVSTRNVVAVASAAVLALFAADGTLIERLSRESLPSGAIARVGLRGGARAVVIQAGEEVFEFSPDFLNWSPVRPSDADTVFWSVPLESPADAVAAAIKAFRGEGLTMHRLVMDIHSGRFFGKAGVWFVDLSAFGLLFLALSGVWYAIAGRRNGQ